MNLRWKELPEYLGFLSGREKWKPGFLSFHFFTRVPSMLFSGLLIALHKMLHCFLLGLSFVGSCRGQKSPPPSGFGVFFVFQNLATMAESSVLRMRAGICDSRVCCSFGLFCCLDLVGSEHFFLFKTRVACRGFRWRP